MDYTELLKFVDPETRGLADRYLEARDALYGALAPKILAEFQRRTAGLVLDTSSPYLVSSAPKPGHTDLALTALYRQLMLQHHPDRGGDKDTCSRINALYERGDHGGLQAISRGDTTEAALQKAAAGTPDYENYTAFQYCCGVQRELYRHVFVTPEELVKREAGARAMAQWRADLAKGDAEFERVMADLRRGRGEQSAPTDPVPEPDPASESALIRLGSGSSRERSGGGAEVRRADKSRETWVSNRKFTR